MKLVTSSQKIGGFFADDKTELKPKYTGTLDERAGALQIILITQVQRHREAHGGTIVPKEQPTNNDPTVTRLFCRAIAAGVILCLASFTTWWIFQSKLHPSAIARHRPIAPPNNPVAHQQTYSKEPPTKESVITPTNKSTNQARPHTSPNTAEEPEQRHIELNHQEPVVARAAPVTNGTEHPGGEVIQSTQATTSTSHDPRLLEKLREHCLWRYTMCLEQTNKMTRGRIDVWTNFTPVSKEETRIRTEALAKLQLIFDKGEELLKLAEQKGIQDIEAFADIYEHVDNFRTFEAPYAQRQLARGKAVYGGFNADSAMYLNAKPSKDKP